MFTPTEAALAQCRILRTALVARMRAARVIAMNKRRVDLATQCELQIKALRRAFDNEVPMYEALTRIIEQDCRNGATLDEIRARHAAGLPTLTARAA